MFLGGRDFLQWNNDFAAEPNQTVIDVQRTDSMTDEWNCFSSSCGRLNFLSWRRKNNLCWAWVNVSVPLQVLRDDGSQEPEWLRCRHSAVHDGEWGESRGVSPEVHGHLHSFERVKLQVVKTAPDRQLLNLLSVSRLVSVLDEADQCGAVCKLQELDRGVFRCVVVGVAGEEQWGENTALGDTSTDDAAFWQEFPQSHQLLPVCQKAGDPLTDRARNRELG